MRLCKAFLCVRKKKSTLSYSRYATSDPVQLSVSCQQFFQASHTFLGPSWNLLQNNCNHFTSYLCQELTGKPAPAWLNRAASIGLCLPCLVPNQWIDAPDSETANGQLIEDEETVAMLKHAPNAIDDEDDYSVHEDSDVYETEDDLQAKWRRKRRTYKKGTKVVSFTDSSGRVIPVSERAPVISS